MSLVGLGLCSAFVILEVVFILGAISYQHQAEACSETQWKCFSHCSIEPKALSLQMLVRLFNLRRKNTLKENNETWDFFLPFPPVIPGNWAQKARLSNKAQQSSWTLPSHPGSTRDVLLIDVVRFTGSVAKIPLCCGIPRCTHFNNSSTEISVASVNWHCCLCFVHSCGSSNWPSRGRP